MPDTLPSVEELLSQARAGDSLALDRLVDRYRELVHLLVRGRCGQVRARVDSSDLVQEVLMRVARNIQQFEGTQEEQWRAWLAKIAERVIIQQLRLNVQAAKRAVGREQPMQAGGENTSRLYQWAANNEPSPSQAVLQKERALQLADALQQLPADYREVLVLRHLEGLDFPEVAQRMGRSHGAVRVLWTRALKKLRDVLTAADDSNGSADHA